MTPLESFPANPHVRAQRALAQRAAWLLDDSEATWLATHLEGCESCRRAEANLNERAEDLAQSSGHLPSRLVAGWERESARLPEIVMSHVRAHLRSCEQCRAEFALLGHNLPTGVAAPAPSFTPTQQGFWVWLRSKGTGFWLLGGGFATAAAALALYLAPILRGPAGSVASNAPPTGVSSPTPHTDSIGGRIPGGTRSGTPPDSGRGLVQSGARPPSEPSLALAGGGDSEAFDMVSLDTPTLRGAGDSSTTLQRTVSKGTRRLGLRHPVAALIAAEDDDRVTIEITTPSGLVLRHVVNAQSFRADRPLVLQLPKGIEAGTYRYTYSYGDGTRTRPVRGEMTLRFR